MRKPGVRPGLSLLLVGSALAAFVGRASAHVDYVTDAPTATRDAVEFAVEVLSEPLNLALVAGGTVGVVGLLTALFFVRPTVPDIEALRTALASYREYVPWMLRLSLGLPLVGAGFTGYLFSPALEVQARLLQVGIGFLLLFGLGTRAVAVAGLLTYLGAFAFNPELVLAIEYVPGFVAIALVGGGRPSADHMLSVVAGTAGTYYGRIDPVGGVAERFARLNGPYERYVATVLRVGVGLAFAYLGLVEKLANPSRAVQVVYRYDLTSVVPVDPGLWVLGAGLTEIGVGLLLVVGYYTRGAAAVAFTMLVMTLFGLPDDPVLAHITLFGMISAIFTLGGGPLSLDAWLSASEDRERERDAVPTAD
ncbi:DoxX family protein [Halosimplex pelagicum]|uniref:DoxX family protein n=1 Tax=Halosimplex pelagicum TaxID=869886 RepID=A0A7D5TUQ8_9EURY|nr:DoxX family protein [Halosimplex pelagicum]QLH83492.1 DoxX family protein [Halosimplex pelagicum]